MKIKGIEEFGDIDINSFKQREEELDLVEYENLIIEKENLNIENGGILF